MANLDLSKLKIGSSADIYVVKDPVCRKLTVTDTASTAKTIALVDKPGFYDIVSKRFFISQSQQEFSYKTL